MGATLEQFFSENLGNFLKIPNCLKEKHFVFSNNPGHRELRTGKPLLGGHASKAWQ